MSSQPLSPSATAAAGRTHVDNEKKKAKYTCIALAITSLIGVGLLLAEMIPSSPISFEHLSSVSEAARYGGAALLTVTLIGTAVSAVATENFWDKWHGI